MLILLVILLSISSSFTLAQDNWWVNSGGSSSGDSIASAISNPIQIAINTLLRLAEATVNLPRHGTTSALALLLTFILLFALIYPATGFIPPFKDAKSQGPRKAFAVAFAILVVFFSPISIYVYEFIRVYLSTLVAIALFALFIVLFWFIIRYSGRGFAEANKVGAESAKINLANKKIHDEVNKERQILKREDHAIQHLEQLTHEEKDLARSEEKKWENLLHRMSKIESISTPAGQQIRDQLIAEAMTLMRREDKQNHINEKLMHLLSHDEHEERRLKALIESNSDQIAEALHNLGGTTRDLNHAKRVVADAKHNASLLINLTKRLENFVRRDHKYESRIRTNTEHVIASLRRNNVAEAAHLVKEIINEIKHEERLLNEILYTEGRMQTIDHHLFSQIKNLMAVRP